MSNFNHNSVIANLQESADKVIQQHQSMQLTSKDTKAFVDDILNPPEPNEILKAAAAEYKKIMKNN